MHNDLVPSSSRKVLDDSYTCLALVIHSMHLLHKIVVYLPRIYLFFLL